MRINVELPDDLMRMTSPGRVALVALALEAYQTEALSPCEVRTLLELSRFELDGLLKQHGIMFGAYGVEDLETDMATLGL